MLVDDAQKPVILGEELARGGEGVIRKILQDSEVAKIYHRPIDKIKVEKLKTLRSSNNDGLRRFTALPTRLLWERGRVVGFAMPAVSARSPVYNLTNPKTRRLHFSGKDYRFLVCVAQNIAKAFAAVHASGIVIGDVNESGILVGADGLVSLIDCDSFQVKAGSTCYVCEVGVPMFTAPELQGRNLNVERTPSHDSFGFSVLLFTLLFMGWHPFSGRFTGVGEMPIERAIAERRFSFAEDPKSLMIPPSNTLTLREVGPLAEMFRRSFCTLDSRPTDHEWLSKLDEFGRTLKRCSANGAHYFPGWSPACPWCRIEAGTGVLLFSVIRIGQVHGNVAVDVAAIWTKIERVQRPTILPFPNLVKSVSPSPGLDNLRRLVRRKKIERVAWFAPALICLCLVYWQPTFGCLGFIFSIIVGYRISARAPDVPAIKAMRSEVNRCRNEISSLKKDWACEDLLKEFDDLRGTGKLLKETLTALPSERSKRITALEKDKRRQQLQAFLDKFPIERAIGQVEGIGRGRVATLRAYRIFTAADVTPTLRVPGFGPTFMGRLLVWRMNLEAQFRFDPNRPLDKQLVAQIETEYQSKLRATLASFERVPQRLEYLRNACDSRVSTTKTRLEAIGLEYSQLIADASHIGVGL